MKRLITYDSTKINVIYIKYRYVVFLGDSALWFREKERCNNFNYKENSQNKNFATHRKFYLSRRCLEYCSCNLSRTSIHLIAQKK